MNPSFCKWSLRGLLFIAVYIGHFAADPNLKNSTFVGFGKVLAQSGSVDEQLLEDKARSDQKKESAAQAKKGGAKGKVTALKKARQAMAARDYPKVITVLRPYIDPPDKEVLSYLAEAFERTQDKTELLRALEIYSATWPEDLPGRIRLGKAYAAQAKYEKAIELFRFVLSKDSKNKDAHLGLLSVFQKRKNSYEAQVILADMEKKFGRDADVLSESCRLQYEDAMYVEATKSCGMAIELDPKRADNHVYLGLIQTARENPKQAEKILFAAAARFPNSELAMKAAGDFAETQKNYEKASALYKNCLKNSGESFVCRLGLARSSFEMRDYEEATKSYTVACKVDQTLRSEVLKKASLARQAGQAGWYDKLRTVGERCGF